MATPAGRCHWTNETKNNIEKEEQTSTAFARIRCQSHNTLPRMASCYTISLVMPMLPATIQLQKPSGQNRIPENDRIQLELARPLEG
ncbi:hypothetical protein TWF706_005655 [Orbilia oligospora]|nr:hypothetical protein TWF706_005655 [Orbilia oligospora]